MDKYFNSYREMISLRGLADRTVNTAISQLRFFTLYVLHKPWDDTQLPMRKFDIYLPLFLLTVMLLLLYLPFLT